MPQRALFSGSLALRAASARVLAAAAARGSLSTTCAVRGVSAAAAASTRRPISSLPAGRARRSPASGLATVVGPVRRVWAAPARNSGAERSSSSSSSSSSPSSSSSASSSEEKEPPSNSQSTVRSLFALYGLLSIVVYLAVSVTNIAIWTWVISCTGERYREPLERWTRWFLPPAELAAGRAVAAAEGGEDAEEAGPSAGPEAPAPAEGPADQSDLHPLWPAFLLAVGVNKLLLPVRLTVTALLTRSAAEWLKRWRWAAGLTASRVKAAP